MTVRWQTSGYTADSYNDFTSGSGDLTFAAGETTKVVRVPIVNDGLKEGTEAFKFSLYSATNADLARPVALGTITDNDATPGKPVVSVSDLVLDEATREASFVITLDRPSNGTVSLNYATQDGTARAGKDFVAKSGTVAFAAGETSKVVKVALINDAAREEAESFDLVLSKLSGATSLDPVGTAVIGANDAPTVEMPNLLVDDASVGESDAFAEFVVRLDAPSTDTVTVRWQTNGYTAASYNDFASSSGELTFAAGETTKVVRVPIVNDGAKEGTEAFKLSLYSATNATITRAVALGTITDNDATPGQPVVSVSDLVVDEADGTASFVVTLDRPSSGTVSLSYATQDGTARGGQDFIAKSGVLNFAAGETSKVIKVTLINDAAREEAESFDLVLSKLSGATSLDPAGTAVIGANDAPAVEMPNLLVDDASVGESDAFAEFVVRLDAPSTDTVTVRWQTNGYTAASYNDFTSSSGDLTFAAGETTKVVRVPIVNDGLKEGTEAFKLSLYSATNATITRAVALGTITDNDATPGKPVASVSDLVVDEADREASFVVTLDRPSNGTVSLNYATQDGTARAGRDFVAKSGVLNFAAGETSKVVKVTLVDDATREGIEGFNLVLSGLTGATSLDPVGTAVIAASDAPAVQTPNLLVDDAYVAEGTAFAEFVVRLDAPSTDTVTVRWQTNGYTADSYNDFTSSSGELTFAVGETTKVVRVPIVNDGLKEGTEAFKLSIYSATNATITRAVALGTIIDNDSGTPPKQTIVGSGADDVLVGTAGNDTLSGEGGNDFLSGGAGADKMGGGLGDDTYLVDDGGDRVSEGVTTASKNFGIDTVLSSVSYALSDNVENLTLIGSNAIKGVGNALNNTLVGNDAVNVLDGGAGADVMKGGGGADTFVFSAALGKSNIDRITDFSADDTIRLAKSIFSAIAPGQLSAAAFKETTTGTVDADDRILFDKKTGALSYDADGSGKAFAAVQFAVLEKKDALTFHDILVA